MVSLRRILIINNKRGDRMKTILIFLLMAQPAFAGVPLEVLTVAYEASGEPFEGQVYVAKVIQNRSQERRLTPEQVILQPYQFSCWDKSGNPTQKRNLTPAEINTARRAWEEAKGISFEANLYHADYIFPRWASSPQVTFLIKVEKHLFYREKR